MILRGTRKLRLFDVAGEQNLWSLGVFFLTHSQMPPQLSSPKTQDLPVLLLCFPRSFLKTNDLLCFAVLAPLALGCFGFLAAFFTVLCLLRL